MPSGWRDLPTSRMSALGRKLPLSAKADIPSILRAPNIIVPRSPFHAVGDLIFLHPRHYQNPRMPVRPM